MLVCRRSKQFLLSLDTHRFYPSHVIGVSFLYEWRMKLQKKSCLLSVQATFKLSKILLRNAFRYYPLWLQTCKESARFLGLCQQYISPIRYRPYLGCVRTLDGRTVQRGGLGISGESGHIRFPESVFDLLYKFLCCLPWGYRTRRSPIG